MTISIVIEVAGSHFARRQEDSLCCLGNAVSFWGDVFARTSRCIEVAISPIRSTERFGMCICFTVFGFVFSFDPYAQASATDLNGTHWISGHSEPLAPRNQHAAQALIVPANAKLTPRSGLSSLALVSTPPATDTTTSPVTGLWWDPDESGWGLSIEQQGPIMFVGWYTYDQTGASTWYVMSSCTVIGDGCSGNIYSTTGGAPTVPWNGHGPIMRVGVGTLT